GDHCQLPPTIKSRTAAAKGLSMTLMEKLAALFPESLTLLEEQYRMHTDIMNFSSAAFYANRLIANPSVALDTLFPGDQPFLFIDTAGCGYDEKLEESSISNVEEAQFVRRHLRMYLEELAQHYTKDSFPSIGIISPYQEQVKTL